MTPSGTQSHLLTHLDALQPVLGHEVLEPDLLHPQLLLQPGEGRAGGRQKCGTLSINYVTDKNVHNSPSMPSSHNLPDEEIQQQRCRALDHAALIIQQPVDQRPALHLQRIKFTILSKGAGVVWARV